MSAKIRYFSSTTCQPCKVLFPKMEKFAKEEGVELEKIVIDALKPGQRVPPDLMGVPSVDLYRDGEYLGRLGRDQSSVKNVRTFLLDVR